MYYSNDCNTGWSGSTIVIGGAILLILLFGMFGGGWGGFGGFGGGYGRAGAFVAGEALGAGLSGCEMVRQNDQNTAAIQKSIADLSARTDLQIATVVDGQKTATIEALRDQLNKAYMDGLAKDSKIDGLQNMATINARFDQLERNQCQLGYALSRKPNIPDFLMDGGFAQATNNCRC